MPATFYQHPSAKAILKDPRDPEIVDKYALPQLGHDEPIRAAIERGEEQMCVCGVPTRHHFTLDLKTWLGCTNAKDRQQGPRNPQRWNDAYPSVTCAVRLALLAKCGPEMEQFFDSAFTHDEKVSIAIEIANAAVTEYRRLERAK